jgi:hypothetical protein
VQSYPKYRKALKSQFHLQADSLTKRKEIIQHQNRAVAWATKYFRCYLYGKQFLVRTDHAAFKFVRNFADNSRLMRCSLRLSEFDFQIEHVPGSKIRHVDTLSRHM